MKTTLGGNETKNILKKYGFPIPNEGPVKTNEGGLETDKDTGFLAQNLGEGERGMEAIIGMKRDAEIGPIVTFSLSGDFTFIQDVS